MLTASEKMGEFTKKDVGFPAEKEVHFGLPRNDEFSRPERNISSLFKQEFKKIVVWYPTFRQHNAGGIMTNNSHGIPIIHDAASAIRLNQSALQNGVLIVIKPHFAQDLTYIRDLKLSNIFFIDDAFFKKNKITSYEFVHATDALITDYSSIYYDFLLARKPIALVWEDLEEYRKYPGFAVDIDYYCKGAEKIYTVEDFEKFLFNVSVGNDCLKQEREEICALANFSSNGGNTDRVVDFICERSSIRKNS
jgi:CDP-glycerol glycerophosphotransferase (TagB/SpsB family)